MGVAAQLSATGLAAEPRGNARRTLHLEVSAAIPGQSATTAVIHNLSTDGLLIETSREVAVADLIEFDLPNAGPQTAEVVWARDGVYGCRFTSQVRPGDISAALLRASFDAPPSLHHLLTPAGNWSPRRKLLVTLALAVLTWAGAAGLVGIVTSHL